MLPPEGAASKAASTLGGTVVDIAVDGGHVRVEMLGSGPPLLLLHGWTLDRRMWLPQRPLADRFTLVAIDRRGFGASTAPTGTAAEPQDVLRVADALGLARFHLLGMSQGGRVALRFGADHPERLLSLILQGTPIDGVPQGNDEQEAVPIAAMAAAAARGDLAAVRALWSGHALVRLHDSGWQPVVDAMLGDYDGRDLLAAAPGVAASVADAARIAVPLLAVTGAHDTAWRRRIAALVAAAGPAGRALTIAAAGHLCNMDRAGDFNAAIADL